MSSIWRSGALMAASSLFCAPVVHAGFAINLQPPATIVAHRIYQLHTLVLWICVGILVVVFGAMSYAVVRHRKSAGSTPASFRNNTRLEIAWTIVPVLILVGMAYPATLTIFAMKDTKFPDMTIKITGHQWQWEYEYPDDNVRFISSLATPRQQIDNMAPKGPNYLLEVNQPLVVPAGKKIRLLITSTDVIHSWWMPKFGVKQDAIPGFIHDAWIRVDAPGIYRGQCAELCGVGHGFMPIVVEAVPPEQFAVWMAGRKQQLAIAMQSAGKHYSFAELKAHGEQVFAANCAVCHQASGAGIPGVFPALDGSRIVNGPKEAHINRVFNGKPGTPMPAFGQRLSDFDIATVITYERNSWHNKMGDAIQPGEIAVLHK